MHSVVKPDTLVIFSKFSPSSAGWHFQRICAGQNCPLSTGGKFAVAGQQIAGASENFVLNY
jgi:hypothetical protein